jgi:hypothetical protein
MQSDNQEATGGKPADVTEPQNGQTAPRAESISREIKQHKSGFLLVFNNPAFVRDGLGLLVLLESRRRHQ